MNDYTYILAIKTARSGWSKTNYPGRVSPFQGRNHADQVHHCQRCAFLDIVASHAHTIWSGLTHTYHHHPMPRSHSKAVNMLYNIAIVIVFAVSIE
jgi:hypothetical protein